jgi:hypothetical protein
MRMALATVSGFSTRLPSTSGAAPAAWKPKSCGAAPASTKPFQYAVTLPALPTGMQSSVGPVAAEVLDQLERRRLLPLQAELVDRVDQRDRVALDELAHERRAPGRSCRAAR